jgi:CheY-like chemotaxis protein
MASLLVVEDNADFSGALSRYLAAQGHIPFCEVDGLSALNTLIRIGPDLVVLDLKLPVMDGVKFLEVVRSYVRFKSTPVVVITGIDDAEVLQQVEHLGVARIFKKGHFDFADVGRAIETALPN